MTEHVRQRLDAYHEGMLDPVESESIRAHLESCGHCRSEYESHVRLEAVLAEATEAPKLTRSLWPGVAQGLRKPAPFRFTLRFAAGTAMAAATGILISLAIPEPAARSVNEESIYETLEYGLAYGGPITLDAFYSRSPE